VIEHSQGKLYRIIGSTTSAPGLPPVVRLEQNVPNPFNPATAIAYTVPEGGAAVRLDVLDLEGRLVRTLIDGLRPAGRHTATWDGLTRRGTPAAAGVYLYRLESDGRTETRKMALVQ
jgi:hypothetical protein